MSINGVGYKEAFLKFWGEGYDAAARYINGSLELYDNPYDEFEQHYEHEAWHAGWWWYMFMVH